MATQWTERYIEAPRRCDHAAGVSFFIFFKELYAEIVSAKKKNLHRRRIKFGDNLHDIFGSLLYRYRRSVGREKYRMCFYF